MIVGIPAEVSVDELRVAASPKTVKRLQKQGFDVQIQSGAGNSSTYSDKDFEDAGAKIVLPIRTFSKRLLTKVSML